MVALTGLVLLVAGCATCPVNRSIKRYDREYGYRFSSLAAAGTEDETFLILAFSGGGTRAAALAYGVLQHLAKTPIDSGRRSLLDEVDVISSVSGGSFTAAFFALNGFAALPQFEERFLRRNVEMDLLKEALLNPYNWWRLLSPTVSRIDLAAEYYDKHLFDGRTYADLLQRRRRPYLVVNATEMDLGARFDFTQERFDPICSDLQALTIGRAVAASSAFPVLLTPVTLKSFAGTCGYREPEWVANALLDYAVNQRRYRSALELRAYVSGEHPYLQLMDGGVADNIGLRGVLHALSSTDGEWSVLRLMNRKKVKRVAVIAVNARTDGEAKLDRNERAPGLVEVLEAVSTAPMQNYSFETVELLRSSVKEWNRDAAVLAECREIVTGVCPDARLPEGELAPVEFYPIEVAFSALTDPDERKFFNRIGTNYALTPEEVGRLIDLGPRLLGESSVFRKLVDSLK
jgi:predicted acylesterase/phospholipase RssA